jgi:hypothetical protein
MKPMEKQKFVKLRRFERERKTNRNRSGGNKEQKKITLFYSHEKGVFKFSRYGYK